MSTHRVGSHWAGERQGALKKWHLCSVLLALVALVLGGCATGHPRGSPLTEVEGSAGGFPGRKADAPRGVRPPGWPDLSSSDAKELLAPFLACTSLEEFLELQHGVDMPRLVEELDDWRAVRLGALGPLGEDAAEVLDRKRAAFLVQATREYGVARAEIFALFVLHSAFDNDLKRVLVLLAGEKQLGETLGQMGIVREELARRGLNLSDYEDRPERLGDVVRGLASAANEALSTSELRRGALAIQYSERRGQLPPPYQQALDEVEQVELERHFSPGNVALRSVDTLTFGVPLGFYYLMAGTGHGVYSLSLGQYEQATRELAPTALMVALYAGGKGLRQLSETQGITGAGSGGGRRFQAPELRFDGLKEVAERLRERLGVDGLRELARYIQANREAAAFVGTGGEPAATALFEARGNVARAQAWLSQAKHQRAPKGEPPTETPIRNAHLSGKKHPVTGVPFDADGYPDFRAAGVVRAEVKITYTGSRARDFAAANKAAGLGETPKGMTWHHHQDGTTLQLVPTETHARTGHTGGFSGGQ